MTKANRLRFDTTRLTGLIEGGIGRRECARLTGIGRQRLDRLLSGEADFTQCEIKQLASVLMLSGGEVTAYFFTPKVQKF
ncbi:MAG: hypothetical protein E7632_04175 [Ruminococcaceae bacterium]|nr:hypothetical protein [Oscillospiraceae bacterium]